MTDRTFPPGDLLNVGSGPHLAPPWVSIDGSWQARLAASPVLARVAGAITGRRVGHWPRGMVCRDVRKGLGRPPQSAAAIYSSHFVEHLHRADAVRFLEECRRALVRGGVCRIVTPDLAVLVRHYAEKMTRAATAADDFMRATLLAEPNGASARGLLAWYRRHTQFETHKWLYDGRSLCALFCEAGFQAPRISTYLESRIPQDLLALVEIRDRVEEGAGVVVEAEA